MKICKICLVLILVIFFSNSLFSQGISAKGIKAGLNLANASGDDSDMPGADKSMRLGFVGGVFINFEVNKDFSIQPEILYSMNGAKYEAQVGDQEATFKLDYIQIPVLAKVNLGEGDTRPFIFVGPYLGILLSAKMEDEDIKDDMKGTDFGLAIGGGVNINNISIDARYNLGLGTVVDVEDVDVKNSTISILLGIAL